MLQTKKALVETIGSNEDGETYLQTTILLTIFWKSNNFACLYNQMKQLSIFKHKLPQSMLSLQQWKQLVLPFCSFWNTLPFKRSPHPWNFLTFCYKHKLCRQILPPELWWESNSSRVTMPLCGGASVIKARLMSALYRHRLSILCMDTPWLV